MRIIQKYRTLLGVDEKATLSELKSVYRALIKEWHPDKFQEHEEEKHAAEEKSKHIISAYHFLVSINPETIAIHQEDYNETILNAAIDDFEFKAEILRIVFADGKEYEYYGVPKAIYVKLVNADTPSRFARRHIFNSYIYRSTSRLVASN